jgi:hypothetical protein
MQRQGLPKGPIMMMFKTIQELEHHVRTIYGDSENSFNSNNPLYAVPIQGVGQGNGAGPMIWALVSAPVLDMLRGKGYGCYFKCALSGEEISFVGYAFVDDYDQVASSKNIQDGYHVSVEQMQGAVDAWNGGVRVTGGALSPSKSFWYLIDFQWSNGEFKYASIEESPATISVVGENGVRQELERLSPKEARRTLGVYLAPDGNNEAQYQQLLQEAKKWADCVRTGHLPRRLAWQSMTTAIMKTLENPLAVSTLTEQQCSDIMKPLLKVGLSHSGIPNSFPRALVHAPVKVQGLNINHLYLNQNVQHIQKILKYCRSATMTGQLIRCSVEQHKVELGLPGPFFCQDYSAWGSVATRTWVSQTWLFVSKNGMRIEDDTPDIPLRAQGDKYIMQVFYNAGYRREELRRLNLCRLFLRAATVADLITADGSQILESAWEGKERLILDQQSSGPIKES